MLSPVESYWTAHTVRSEPFASAADSLAYLDRRSADYPLFHELMGLWGDHANDVVLDYGCGPANDMVGFLVHGHAKRVIGIDVSQTALELAERRLALHALDRWQLRKVSDDVPVIPLPDASIDYIYCEGVLHHVSHPAEILAEFHRVLRPGGEARVMVYNYDSIFLHLYVAYYRQLHDGLAGPIEAAFQRSTDGNECPVSVPYRPSTFLAMCEAAGFGATFRGGYYSDTELNYLHLFGPSALADPRLADEHKAFLRRLEPGDLPTIDGLPVGIGGTYWLRR